MTNYRSLIFNKLSLKRLTYILLLIITPLFLWTIIYQSKSIQTNAVNQSDFQTNISTAIPALPSPALLPVKMSNVSPVQLVSKAVYVIDVNSMSVLYQQNPDAILPIASTTKIMTALVALEHYPLDRVLVVDGTITDGSNAGLMLGEKYFVKDLLGALLVGSANDAAEVLATNFPGGTDGFVWAMNRKAAELKMQDTHFTNPIGYDHPEHYSSAKDLAILSVAALRQPLFASLVAKKEYVLLDETKSKSLLVKNTNELLGQDASVFGVKTGWTEAAGECLVAFAQRDNCSIVTVVLGSDNRFKETENLINWIYDNYSWEEITY